MSDRFWTPAAHASKRHRYRARFPKLPLLCLLLGTGVLAGTLWRQAPEPAAVGAPPALRLTQAVQPQSRSEIGRVLFDSRLVLVNGAMPFAASAPLSAALQRDVTETGSIQPGRAMTATAALSPAPLPAMAALPQPPAEPVQAEKPAERLVAAPLPVSRPQGLTLIGPRDAAPATAPSEAPASARAVTRRGKTAPAAANPASVADNRNFIEKLFGVQPKEQGTQLAYAAPQDDVVDRSRNFRLTPAPTSPPPSGMAARTAVYNIRAKTVYMPNGDRLEAHSGLGEKMDDPSHAHVRMHGPTPPHVYTLTEREALFHGVRALRLNPVGGSKAIHGRAGLLTHTYLLGPRGDSNGCVSFKDYDKFLQAYLRGEVTRLVVVAGEG